MGLFLPKEAVQPAPAPFAPPPAPRRSPGVRRWLFHGVLTAAFALAGAALLVWPQWIAVDGGESTLALLREREQELSDRLDASRAGMTRLRYWQREGRRVFLADEAARYPVLAQAMARQEGAVVVKATVSEGRSQRWRPVLVDQHGAGGVAGEIRPRTVRLVVRGSFEAVYRTLAALTQQQQLFVPDRWDLVQRTVGGKPEVWGELAGTIFVVTEPEAAPAAPISTAPVAQLAQVGREGAG
jgi:hypothetical protein